MSAQELERSAGSLLGLVAGGVLVAESPELLFIAAAVLLPVLAVPTAVILRRSRAFDDLGDADGQPHDRARPRDLLAVARCPGAREVLAAQALWVLAYVALPTFFILYATEVLGVGPPASSFALAGVALLAGAGTLVAGTAGPGARARRAHRRRRRARGGPARRVGLTTSPRSPSRSGSPRSASAWSTRSASRTSHASSTATRPAGSAASSSPSAPSPPPWRCRWPARSPT